jgi:hypothetical protein
VLVSRWRKLRTMASTWAADAARQRALAGLLDHRAVGHRVAERHAELDDVGAAGGQRVHHSGVASANGSPAVT